MKPLFNDFTLAIKSECLILGIFQSFEFFFDKLPPQIHVLKDALNHFLVHSREKNNLKSAKNVVFFLFCILVNRPWGAIALAPLVILLYVS